MQEILGIRIYTGHGHEEFTIGKKLNPTSERHVSTLVDSVIVIPTKIEVTPSKIRVHLDIFLGEKDKETPQKRMYEYNNLNYRIIYK